MIVLIGACISYMYLVPFLVRLWKFILEGCLIYSASYMGFVRCAAFAASSGMST